MRWLAVSVLVLWALVSSAATKKEYLGEESHRNLVETPDYECEDDSSTEKEQYAPALNDDPPVKDQEVTREITDGVILEPGKEAVIDPAPDYDRTFDEITEESK